MRIFFKLFIREISFKINRQLLDSISCCYKRNMMQPFEQLDNILMFHVEQNFECIMIIFESNIIMTATNKIKLHHTYYICMKKFTCFYTCLG